MFQPGHGAAAALQVWPLPSNSMTVSVARRRDGEGTVPGPVTVTVASRKILDPSFAKDRFTCDSNLSQLRFRPKIQATSVSPEKSIRFSGHATLQSAVTGADCLRYDFKSAESPLRAAFMTFGCAFSFL